MSCVAPLKGYRNREGGWTANPLSGFADMPMTVPCGQCIGCRLEHARQWAIRCMHESQMHEHNSFLTLTYSDDNLPDNKSLRKSDMTDFLKRLRYHIAPIKIRYLQCGEYGENTYRPHHHMILFGYEFPDLELLRAGENKLWRSSMLDEIWSHGHCSIGTVTFESAGYVARYTLEKVTGPGAKEYYDNLGVIPPYLTMSRRPGIGHGWLEAFQSDVYPMDGVVLANRRVKCLPPKYYDNQLKDRNESLYQQIKARRRKSAELCPEKLDPDRLYARQVITVQKLRQYSRDGDS